MKENLLEKLATSPPGSSPSAPCKNGQTLNNGTTDESYEPSLITYKTLWETLEKRVLRPQFLSVLVSFISIAAVRLASLEHEVLDEETLLRNQYISGIKWICVIFMVYAAFQLRDGELVKPHPLVWRLVNGSGVLYLMFLVFLLFQSVDTTNFILQLFDSSIGSAPLPKYDYGTYATNCEFWDYNAWVSKIWDVYFLAHLVGWFVKALILRDWTLMWFCSVLFEVMEVSLEGLLPNFEECWWDRWLLDVFGCNLIGMVVGMRVAAYLGAHAYNWHGIDFEHDEDKSSKTHQNASLVIRIVSPETFPRRYEWHAFQSWRNFGVSFLVVAGVQLGEINGFLLKSALQIPTSSPINAYRVVFSVLAVYAAVVEMYAYVSRRRVRVGATAWLVLSVLVVELALATRHFTLRGAFSDEQLVWTRPGLVLISWIASAVLGAALVFSKVSGAKRYVQRWLAFCTLLPFAALLAHDAWRTSRIRPGSQ